MGFGLIYEKGYSAKPPRPPSADGVPLTFTVRGEVVSFLEPCSDIE
jgi:hypothetical protein